ncbi:MAG TPA: cysteine desulfurase family protein [Xanthobacteraceae bacterium]|nr:cysteine desulfurase family protein [Xanthobacteraceae bacterium]
MTERIYLDWNATAPPRSEARAAALAALEANGNPSSVHREGRAARRLVEQAREQVAALVGAEPRNVVFTSGGTEANMLALVPMAARERLLTSAIEHPSVLAGGRFPAGNVERLPVTGDGQIDLAALERRMAALGGRALVSIMAANNETGVVQPISQAACLVHSAGGLLHVDAVQAAGRIACDISAMGADLVTLSAHKIGGPKGVGALIARTGLDAMNPLITGGGQERGVRAGTENVAGIAGFGAAAAGARASLAADAARMAALRERLETGLKAATPEVLVFGVEAERLPNTTLFAGPGMKAETAVIAFDLEGVAVSAGAACSSGKIQPSHVLAAMGVPPQLARAAVRVSLGPTTMESDVDRFIAAWIKVSGALLKQSQGIAA